MNLCVWGKNGKMGQLILAMAAEDGEWSGLQGCDVEEPPRDDAGNPQVVIDFSHPSALDDVLAYCRQQSCALVMGTTGHSPVQLEQIRETAAVIPVVHATNMSLGMNLLFSLVKETAAALKNQADIEVIEAHHNRKKDAPSGSAKTIVESIEAGLAEERPKVYGREGEAHRQPGEIGTHSIRGGNIVGRHEAWFINELESIALVHEAHDRSVFARGALTAARFAVEQKPGLYHMTHVLGMESIE